MLNDGKLYHLPQNIAEKLLTLTEHFGLNYGAIDVIVTPDGGYVFLEVNSVREFCWLERCPGLPILSAIAL